MLLRFFLLVVGLLFASVGQAQLLQTHAGGAAFTYVGPNDVVSGAKVLFGLRGMSAAYSTGSNPAVTVRRASDNTTQNINILSNGNLDVASANTFAGIDATASCTISTTTATCTGASSTPHVGSTISGVGLTQPCFATAVGTFTGGAGTVTLKGTGSSPCGTVSVAETLTFQYGLFVTKWFDQSGNGTDCFNGATNVACDAVQATSASQPELLTNCINSLPCMWFNGTSMNLETQEISAGHANPIQMVHVNLRLGTGGSFGGVEESGSQVAMFSSTNAGKASIYAGSSAVDFTASDNVWHVIQGQFNGASSIGTTDATDTTSLNPGSTALANGQNWWMGSNSAQTQWFPGYLAEVGLWYIGFSSGQRTSYCHNAFAYWGTSVSC